MNLKRQLLLVSLLTLVLPWAGWRFISETESALRSGQQQMLAGTARAIGNTLGEYPEEFPVGAGHDEAVSDQLYVHPLSGSPEIDGYVDDWSIDRTSLRTLHGTDGQIHFALGIAGDVVYLYAEVSDRNIVYAGPGVRMPDAGPPYFDAVTLVNTSPLYLDQSIVISAEAPGPVLAVVRDSRGMRRDPAITAHWLDVPGGYQVEARIPTSRLGTNLGVVVSNTGDPQNSPARSASFSTRLPAEFVTVSPELQRRAEGATQPGTRLIVTDKSGWRIASSGQMSDTMTNDGGVGSVWMRYAYDALVESGESAEFAEPDPSGREQRDYIRRALSGQPDAGWFRSPESGRAVVAVAQPIQSDGEIIGALVLQQGTDEILSLRNQGLVRLMNGTLIATLLVAAGLLGYATWLSRRIRRLSIAAEQALETDSLRSALPSASAGDEIGDLSRSFANVLRQLGDYNAYLRSLASKLSHELRTPLAIVTSSLENLEHEDLDQASAGYAARAREGADRLRRILTAMSEASRVEELMSHAEPERFDLHKAIDSTVAAYRDAYSKRRFVFDSDLASAPMSGSPELLIQMLDKLVDNAVEFSQDGDTISIALRQEAHKLQLGVTNPGPPLPERMRHQLFDSMVSVRPEKDDRHLGLGLYIAKLIAEGHGGRIDAENLENGVTVRVTLPGEPNGK